MNATVVVAAMGFVSTLFGAWLAAYWQHRSSREVRIFDAKVRAYGDCAAALYEYERAAYNRAKARLESRTEGEREELRQEAYRANARARSAIGQAAILSEAARVTTGLEDVRSSIGDLARANHPEELRRLHDGIYDSLNSALANARSDLHGDRPGRQGSDAGTATRSLSDRKLAE
jgi:triphosphoribosyl-dephospho-CoA synthetase